MIIVSILKTSIDSNKSEIRVDLLCLGIFFLESVLKVSEIIIKIIKQQICST